MSSKLIVFNIVKSSMKPPTETGLTPSENVHLSIRVGVTRSHGSGVLVRHAAGVRAVRRDVASWCHALSRSPRRASAGGGVGPSSSLARLRRLEESEWRRTLATRRTGADEAVRVGVPGGERGAPYLRASLRASSVARSEAPHLFMRRSTTTARAATRRSASASRRGAGSARPRSRRGTGRSA